MVMWIFSGRGIYILYEDVKSCPYEDVHVLWSILVESTHAPPHALALPPQNWSICPKDKPEFLSLYIIHLFFQSKLVFVSEVFWELYFGIIYVIKQT